MNNLNKKKKKRHEYEKRLKKYWCTDLDLYRFRHLPPILQVIQIRHARGEVGMNTCDVLV